MSILRWNEVEPLGDVLANVATSAGVRSNLNDKYNISGENQNNFIKFNLEWWWWLVITVVTLLVVFGFIVSIYFFCLRRKMRRHSDKTGNYKILPKRKYKRESANPLIPLVHVNRNSGSTVYSIDEDCRTVYNNFPSNVTAISAE
jgi:hypothetical protein